MVITPHVLTSLVLTTNLERIRVKKNYTKSRKRLVLIACICSFVSHFLLDSVPHYDYSIVGLDQLDVLKITADIILAGIIFAIAFHGSFVVTHGSLVVMLEELDIGVKSGLRRLPMLGTLIIGVFFSVLPDVIVQFSTDFGRRRTLLYSLHGLLHTSTKLDFSPGIFIEIGISLVFIYILIKSAARFEADITCREIGEEQTVFFKP
jgi:hypothetical protein